MPGDGYNASSFKATQMNDQSFKIQRADGRTDVCPPHFRQCDGHEKHAGASKDDFECFEQMVFERAVRRELSGDVDFE